MEVDKIEDEKPSEIKKVFIALIAVFLIFLFFSYIILGVDVISIFEGRLVSYKVENSQIKLKNGGGVVFGEGVYEGLRELYDLNQAHEVSACIRGYKADKSYFADSFYIPNISKQTVFEVDSEMCDAKTIIALHTHPYKRCIFSGQDINYYNYFRNINPDGIISLMCERDRFSFYGY